MQKAVSRGSFRGREPASHKDINELILRFTKKQRFEREVNYTNENILIMDIMFQFRYIPLNSPQWTLNKPNQLDRAQFAPSFLLVSA